MKICFLITTFNRQQSCQELVDALYGLGDIYVLNDGSNYEIKRCNFYSHSVKKLIKDKWIEVPFNFGKPGYWQTVNQLWSLPAHAYDYYFMIPDDFMPYEDFLEQTINIWKSIKDPRKICINTYRDLVPRSTCWTNFTPVEYGNYRMTQWIDMCFMAESRFFKEVGKIPRINFNWQQEPLKSSGVGAWISKRLHRTGWHIYQTTESMFLAKEEHNTSQLNRR